MAHFIPFSDILSQVGDDFIGRQHPAYDYQSFLPLRTESYF